MSDRLTCELCSLMCGMSVPVRHILDTHAIPCEHLTPLQGGWLVSQLAGNEWRLPDKLKWVRGRGSMTQRWLDTKSGRLL